MTIVAYLLTFVGVLSASYGAGTVLAATLGLRSAKERLTLMVDEQAYWNHVRLMQRCNRLMAIGAILVLVGVVIILRDRPVIGSLVFV